MQSSQDEAAEFLRAPQSFDPMKMSFRDIDAMIQRAESGQVANETVANLLEILSGSLSSSGDHSRAERALNAALSIRRAQRPMGDPAIGKTLATLGNALFIAGQPERAEAVLREANSLYETKGVITISAIEARLTIASVYLVLGRTREVPEQMDRIAEFFEAFANAGKPVDRTYSAELELRRGDLAQARHRFATAERHYLAAVEQLESIVGVSPFAGPIMLKGSKELVLSLARLARSLTDQHRFDEAEKYLLRATGLGRAHLGEAHPYLVELVSNLGYLQESRGFASEAAETYRDAFQRYAKTHAFPAPGFVILSSNLAGALQKQGQFALASKARRVAVSASRANYGRESAAYAVSLAELAAAYRGQGELELARGLVDAATVLIGLAGADAMPEAIIVHVQRARIEAASGRRNEALVVTRRALELLADVEGRLEVGENRVAAETVAFAHLDNLKAVIKADGDPQDLLAAEGLRTRQALRQDNGLNLDLLLSAQVARNPERGAQLARWRETRERLAYAREALESELRRPATRRSAALERGLREERDGLLADEREQRRRLIGVLSPSKGALASDMATPAELKAALGPGDALLSWIFDDTHGYLWLQRHDRLQMVELNVGRIDIERQVAQLRRGLDLGRSAGSGSRIEFDTAASHALYRSVLAPAVAHLDGVRRLHLVPDGALQEIPFGVLVMAPPEVSGSRPARWLATAFDLRVHPSEASFVGAAGRAGMARAPLPMVGFGDPDFGAYALNHRRGFAPLPDTVVELSAVANELVADMRFVYTRSEASEARLRATALDNFRVLYFATHTVLGDEAEQRGLGFEPGIVLTPGPVPSETGDGLLTASEVAGLRLNADLVVLSGCNSAAQGGVSGARGLSGLTRAFFIAGARAVLASHWSVSSRATTRLLGGAFLRMSSRRGMEIDEALRLASGDMAAGVFGDEYRQPAFWAPFTVFGQSIPLERQGTP